MQFFEVKEVYGDYQANQLLRCGGWTVLDVHTKSAYWDRERTDVIFVLGRIKAYAWERPWNSI